MSLLNCCYRFSHNIKKQLGVSNQYSVWIAIAYLTQWDVHCCSDESRRCSGGAWCSGSYSAHPQAGRPECTRRPWMGWDIFVLKQIKTRGNIWNTAAVLLLSSFFFLNDGNYKECIYSSTSERCFSIGCWWISSSQHTQPYYLLTK